MNKHARIAAANDVYDQQTRNTMTNDEIDKRLAVADWPHNITYRESVVIPTLTDVVPFDPFVEASALKDIIPFELDFEFNLDEDPEPMAVPPSVAFTFPNVPLMPRGAAVFDDSELAADALNAFRNRVARLAGNVQRIKVEDLEVKLAACKRALAISNKFTDADEKKKYRARAMSNMNKIRAQLAKATKHVSIR